MSRRTFDMAFLDSFHLQGILQVLKRRKYRGVNTKVGAMGSSWGHFVIFFIRKRSKYCFNLDKNHDKGNLLHNTI